MARTKPKRRYPLLPGRQIAEGERPTISARRRADLTFLVGQVTSVDPLKQIMSVDLFDNVGSPQSIGFAQPFASTSGYIMGMPDVGTLVILANQENFLWPIAYLPNFYNGLDAKNMLTREWPEGVSVNDKNEYYYRVKKMKPGDVAMASKEGAEIYLSDNLRFDDRSGNSFLLRSDADSFIRTALNDYVFMSGVWRNAGIITRNSFDQSDDEDATYVYREPLGREGHRYVLKPGASDSRVNPYYTEYLIEVDDTGMPIQPVNDVNSATNRTVRRPVAVFSLGNLAGNNPDVDTYARLLKVRLFNDADDRVGDFSLEPLQDTEIDNLGMAISLLKPERNNPERGAFFGVDKEGHFFQFIPSATGGGIGKGRSMSIVARGSKKEIWGEDTRYNNSWDLRTIGGIKWDVGSHNERDGSPYSNRSIDIRTSSSVYQRIGSEVSDEVVEFDNDNTEVSNLRDYYKIEKVGGHERHEVEGYRETIVESNDKLRIEGAREEEVVGGYNNSVQGAMNLTVGDMYTEKVNKEKAEQFGSRKTSIAKGSSELEIQSLVGSIKEEIKFTGFKTTKIKLGGITEEITSAGSRSFKTKFGNHTINTKLGFIEHATDSGSVTLKTKLGSLTAQSSLGIDIKTQKFSNINIDGGVINLKGTNSILGMGGVVTDKTHVDYITGAPPKGSSSVKASGTLAG